MDINDDANILGGAGAIGRATALAFAHAGVTGVMNTDIDQEAAKSTFNSTMALK
ncbi:hypothetical protein F5Y16DRAFT_399000 [Xylariaceae sp. FL0255]|nr:hypothetical protein F5Y16DRAFT_399000 [Xylariaceae sp. FL0255]